MYANTYRYTIPSDWLIPLHLDTPVLSSSMTEQKDSSRAIFDISLQHYIAAQHTAIPIYYLSIFLMLILKRPSGDPTLCNPVPLALTEPKLASSF